MTGARRRESAGTGRLERETHAQAAEKAAAVQVLRLKRLAICREDELGLGRSGLRTAAQGLQGRVHAARRASCNKVSDAFSEGFDPPGVCARNLTECLAIQLKERNRYDPAMAALLTIFRAL